MDNILKSDKRIGLVVRHVVWGEYWQGGILAEGH